MNVATHYVHCAGTYVPEKLFLQGLWLLLTEGNKPQGKEVILRDKRREGGREGGREGRRKRRERGGGRDRGEREKDVSKAGMLYRD